MGKLLQPVKIRTTRKSLLESGQVASILHFCSQGPAKLFQKV